MRVTPHLVAELRARQHPLGVRGQDREEVELGHRQRDLVFADLHPPSGVVDLQRADAQDPLSAAAGFREGGAAKVRVDARGKDAGVEGLGDVVVGADLETDDLVHLGRAAGEHDHRADHTLATQLADYLGAADVWEHPVHKHQVRLRAATELDGLRARSRLDDVVSLEAADLGHEHPHGHVVLDDEDSTAAARWWAAQPGFGGAKPTRRDSRAERFGLRIRITRLSPPSTTLASSHPSAAWATLRTRVENSHSRLGSPTAGISPAAAPRAPSGWAGAGSSGSSSGSSSNLGSIGSIVVDSRLCLNN